MTKDGVLTVKDLLEYLNEKVSQNPKVLNYQLARTEYDDFSISYTHFTYACNELSFIKLPKSKGMTGVDDELTSKKILLIN